MELGHASNGMDLIQALEHTGLPLSRGHATLIFSSPRRICNILFEWCCRNCITSNPVPVSSEMLQYAARVRELVTNYTNEKFRAAL